MKLFLEVSSQLFDKDHILNQTVCVSFKWKQIKVHNSHYIKSTSFWVNPWIFPAILL